MNRLNIAHAIITVVLSCMVWCAITTTTTTTTKRSWIVSAFTTNHHHHHHLPRRTLYYRRLLNSRDLSFSNKLLFKTWSLTATSASQSSTNASASVSSSVEVLVDASSSEDDDQQQKIWGSLDCFHEDMRRILQTRREWMKEQPNLFGDEYTPFAPWFQNNDDDDEFPPRIVPNLNRRQKPPILLPNHQDFDSAERVHQMLQVLLSSRRRMDHGGMTEREIISSYEIVMRAYLQRGRLRWKIMTPMVTMEHEEDDDGEKNIDFLFTSEEEEEDDEEEEEEGGDERVSTRKDKTIVCAADVIHDLWMQLLEERHALYDDVDDVELWNAAAACWMAAQAMCATPRGGNYGQRVLDFIDTLRKHGHKDDIIKTTTPLPIEALLHGIHASAWQQGNLQPGKWAKQADDLRGELANLLKPYRPSDKIHLWARDQSFSVHDIRMQSAAWTLEAWSKSGSPGSASCAQAILEEMMGWNATLSHDQTNWYLDGEVYSNAILAWVKDGQVGRAQNLLEQMIEIHRSQGFPKYGSEPPLIAFNSVISGWGKQKETERAIQVLVLLQKTQKYCPGLVPDAVAYNSILYSFLNSGRDESKKHAQALIRYMENNCDSQPAIRPNAFTYHTYIKCLLNGRAPVDSTILRLVDEALSKLENLWKQGDRTVEPNNRIFNMVINAYAKSQDRRRAVPKAFDLLERMKQAPNLFGPDVISMTSVMECLSKSSSPEACTKALDLLKQALRLYHETKNQDLMPNVRIFTMAILTLSQNYGNVEDAQKVLNQLVKLYEETKHENLKPNTYPYNYVLNCAANALENKTVAFRIASQTYQAMRKSPYVRPDSFTYGFWIKCCNNLLDDMDLRMKCVKYAFEECQRQGLVTDPVLTRLYQGTPAALVKELLDSSPPAP